MTDPQDLLRLADEVAAATGPDRRLDHAIQLWCINNGRLGSFKTAEAWLESAVAYAWGHANFTTSLDAARTLVPEGWAVESLTWWPASPEGASNVSTEQSSVRMVGTSIERMGRRMIWGHGSKDGRVEASAATPALALCAAALRARAHSTKETSNG